MKQDREIIAKEYAKLLKDVETKDFYTKVDLTNRVNNYGCVSCGHITKTIDRDAGVTWFIHTCEKCGAEARSTFFKDLVPDRPATQEFYRPTLDELYTMSPGMIDHVLQGGLAIRNISSQPHAN
jgi:hypothetical protein